MRGLRGGCCVVKGRANVLWNWEGGCEVGSKNILGSGGFLISDTVKAQLSRLDWRTWSGPLDEIAVVDHVLHTG